LGAGAMGGVAIITARMLQYWREGSRCLLLHGAGRRRSAVLGLFMFILLAWPPLIPAHATGTIDQMELIDISGDVSVSYGRTRRDRRDGQSRAGVLARNVSGNAISGTVIAVIDNISNPGVTLANPDGTIAPDGSPYVDLTDDLGGFWAPDAVAPGLGLLFDNPGLVNFTFEARFFLVLKEPAAFKVTSSVLSDTDGRYPTGRTVRFDVTAPPGPQVISGTICITSRSTGYDSGVQKLSFGSIFYLWNTSGLTPADDYVVAVAITDADGTTTTDASLTVSLTINPPSINKLVNTVDVSFAAVGIPVQFVRSYLLDSDFEGPLGHGWTHNYRMRAVEFPAFEIPAVGALLPLRRVVQIFNGDGTGSYFMPNADGTYQSPKGE
jgi:hypothetical protein